jgi:ABC-type Zn uptake system ZnuABC Zn-binding protein ZnuA
MSSLLRQPLRLGINSLFTAGLLAAAALAAACNGTSNGDGTQAPSGAKLAVVATTVQIAALTKEVGGDEIELHGIIPAGADAHEFEPRPSDLAAIADADLILRHGIGLDDWLDGTLEAGSNATVVTVTGGITTAKGEEDGEEVDDPHVWHDPDNAKIMVDDIAAALAAADPNRKSVYDANASAYKEQLDETKAEVQAIIDEIPPEDRKLVTNHDAFGYFARAFGLEIVGAVIPSVSTESEPSAQDTARLLDTIREQNVKAIFAESSVNAQLATTLAGDAGVTIVDDLYGDSLGEPGSGAETVDGMLLYNARKIADALK